MTLPDHTDIPDHDADLYPHDLPTMEDTDDLQFKDCPEYSFALGCIVFAAIVLLFVYFVLPYLFR